LALYKFVCVYVYWMVVPTEKEGLSAKKRVWAFVFDWANGYVCCRVEQCDVKSSKKRPLFLVWTNPDPMAQCLSSDFQIIFKSGDGQWMYFIFIW